MNEITLKYVDRLEAEVMRMELAPDGVQTLKAAYLPHFSKAQELAESAGSIAPSAPKAARALRLEIKSVRVAADKTRKALKEDSLRRGKAIDGIYNLLEYQIVPLEEAMEGIEKAEEIAEANRRDALRAKRCAELSAYTDPTFYKLGEMPEAEWLKLLSGAKAAHEAQRAAEKAASEEKARLEAEEKAARVRLQAENERLAALAETERKAREVAERKAKAERAEIEKRAAADKAEAERKAKAEAAKRAKLEEELRAIEKIKADAAAAAKKAAKAPDKEKILAFVETLRALPVPQCSLRSQIMEKLLNLADWIEEEAAESE